METWGCAQKVQRSSHPQKQGPGKEGRGGGSGSLEAKAAMVLRETHFNFTSQKAAERAAERGRREEKRDWERG